jgi:hypothetical protein
LPDQLKRETHNTTTRQAIGKVSFKRRAAPPRILRPALDQENGDGTSSGSGNPAARGRLDRYRLLSRESQGNAPGRAETAWKKPFQANGRVRGALAGIEAPQGC